MNQLAISEKMFVDHVDLFEFGSPIEEEFYRVIFKYLHPDVELSNQCPVKAGKYNFKIDFVVNIGARKIGIECDGKDYHDTERDQWRDKTLIGGGYLDGIIRLRGTDIVFRLPDALFVVAQWYPEMFSDRGHDNLHRLATWTARQSDIFQDYAYIEYPRDHECEGEFSEAFGKLYVQRRIR